ncbi:MAG: AMP-dependent synthetase [Chloroflexi bacterium 13_1_40CM_3_65_12]|nr:MAG: AMP-dependent synthetase [Chloroflexi bacterium 13_1_40CM_65_17]OLC67341.1 MAG: AMP-dependent synthetase [Actinobacteria bacterium 13_1_40CM_4_65_12]OLD23537.1 MAG: AMP-dependent synthetase [Chloroflexi bacterium 13_1_40CM_3_65_12]OLD48640.1 MAG: AMP-dependent synthetase [Actinobacteria bacterium 13_1_40CM_2_65_8]
MLESFRGRSIDEIERDFRWSIPVHYNLGVDCSDRQLPSSPALIHEKLDGAVESYSFGDLAQLSNRFANALRSNGIGLGDRVAIVLPQLPATVIAHLAVYKLGGIAVPMSTLFGPDAFEMRLRDSGTKLIVTDEATLPRIEEIADHLPDLRRFVLTSGVAGARPSMTMERMLSDASPQLKAVRTKSEDPALLIYTSGTTGGPKGALHGHRMLFGHLPGFELSHDFFPQADDLFWTPADWAWIGGLMDALFPALHHGRCTFSLESSGAFDPERALSRMAKHAVRNTFLPPTALKMMRQGDARPARDLRLRTIMSGGEALGEEMLDWVRERLGVTVNEIYGQTECNYVVGNSWNLYPVKPGSMGRGYPGHRVAVVDEQGKSAGSNKLGEIAVKRPDPVMFLGYWQNPKATKDKYLGEWLLTGDLARADDDGYLYFAGRKDDVINSAGYRIGPTEIESTLIKHPAVAMAAVIGVPDKIRGEVVKAYITTKHGVEGSGALATEIQAFVKTRLAAYEYPREVEFIDQMPLTTTGKIRRNELRARHQGRSPEATKEEVANG